MSGFAIVMGLCLSAFITSSFMLVAFNSHVKHSKLVRGHSREHAIKLLLRSHRGDWKFAAEGLDMIIFFDSLKRPQLLRRLASMFMLAFVPLAVVSILGIAFVPQLL